MLVYRISKANRIEDLSGIGSKLHGGRWNEKGTPLVYTSSSISLAMLEGLVHFPIAIAPPDLSIATILIPDELINNILDINYLGILPVLWQEYPPTLETQRFIKTWIIEKKTLILKVPSAINKIEYNYLINPLHNEIGNISIINISRISFDNRLLNKHFENKLL